MEESEANPTCSVDSTELPTKMNEDGVQEINPTQDMDESEAKPKSSVDVNEVHSKRDDNVQGGELTAKVEHDGDDDSKVGFKTPMLIGARPGFKRPATFDNPLLSKNKDKKEGTPKSLTGKEDKKDSISRGKIRMAFSPAEQLKLSQSQAVSYMEPIWGGLCSAQYNFEILKSGTIVDHIDLTEKSYFVFGRLPSCDITMEHPSLSRYHCVVQYCAKKEERLDVGWYLYDLDSSHGTVVNKVKVKPRVYTRIRVGHVVKFGGSTRLHILQGPDEDQDEESELSVSEIVSQRAKQKAEVEILRLADDQKQGQIQVDDNQGCSWGMSEAPTEVEEPTGPEVTFSLEDNESLYLDDPKKALKRYFEREGLDMPEYEFLEGGALGKHRCRIELPIDDAHTGEPISADITMSGKKREAVIACALEACRVLDRHGELRKAKMESRKRKTKDWEEDDFYESDEDTFLDRTGTIEKKRILRMNKSGKTNDTETYQTLVDKLEIVEGELHDLEKKLDESKQATLQSEDLDDLDAYMMSIKSGAMDKSTRMKLKRQIFDLKQQEQKLRRLANIARPPELPELKASEQKKLKSQEGVAKVLPVVGKIKGPTLHSTRKLPQPGAHASDVQTMKIDDRNVVEEEEDDEEIEDKMEVQNSEGSSKNESQSKEPIVAPKLYGLIKSSDIKTESKTKIVSKHPDDDDDNSRSREKSVEKVPAESSKKDSKYGPVRPTLDFLEGGPSSKSKKAKKDKQIPSEKERYTDPDEDTEIDSWLPPTGQSGDGKTSLNDKYGY